MNKNKKGTKKPKKVGRIQCQYCGVKRNTKHEGACSGIALTECDSCTRVVTGREECIGCQGDFASREERDRRDCPLTNGTNEALMVPPPFLSPEDEVLTTPEHNRTEIHTFVRHPEINPYPPTKKQTYSPYWKKNKKPKRK